MAGKVATIIDFCPGKKRKVSGCLTSFLSMRRRPLQPVTKYLLSTQTCLRMATPSREKYLKYKFHQLYPNIQHSEVILAPFNHGRHWCLVVVNLEENFSVYLDSLYDGAGAKMAFSRVNNFLTCCASINGINTWTLKNWKYFVIPSYDIAQQLNNDECGVFVAT